MKNYIYTFAAIATVLAASCDDMNELVAQGDYALTSQVQETNQAVPSRPTLIVNLVS